MFHFSLVNHLSDSTERITWLGLINEPYAVSIRLDYWLLLCFGSVTDSKVTPTRRVEFPSARSTADREFYLGTVGPRTRNHPDNKYQNKPALASNGSQPDNSTEALLQMILNNIKLKSDSRLRPKLGSKYTGYMPLSLQNENVLDIFLDKMMLVM